MNYINLKNKKSLSPSEMFDEIIESKVGGYFGIFGPIVKSADLLRDKLNYLKIRCWASNTQICFESKSVCFFDTNDEDFFRGFILVDAFVAEKDINKPIVKNIIYPSLALSR